MLQEALQLLALYRRRELLEVDDVPLATIRHVEHEEAPLVLRRRHDPVLIRGHHYLESVWHHYRRLIFAFKGQLVFRDEGLQSALVPLITAPEALIDKQEEVLHQMSVEPTKEVILA